MKKKKYGNERLNLLSELLTSDVKSFIENKDEIFLEKKPLRIEIGCGKGDFICGKSVQEPEYNYLAIEKILDVCVLAVENYATLLQTVDGKQPMVQFIHWAVKALHLARKSLEMCALQLVMPRSF